MEKFFFRIVIKFCKGIPHTSQWKDFLKINPGIKVNKLFTSLPAASITRLVKKSMKMDKRYRPPDFLSYYVATCPATYDSKKILRTLNTFKEVELAYMQSLAATPSHINGNTPDKLFKGYLEPSPSGIDAKYAWTISPGSKKLSFIDIEQGWILNHTSYKASTLPLTGHNLPEFSDHGAGVLGIGTSIVPNLRAKLISQWRPGGAPNDADAILAAISYLQPGDIILLETQSFYQHDHYSLWPAEIQDATFQAIRLATALGVIVIEPAGNGNAKAGKGNNLDQFNHNKKRVLNPGNKSFKDSGAIIVAAATAAVPHQRMRTTNYGQRIDCYAWGEKVATAGIVFNGTSSASAIIAGVVMMIQSICEKEKDIRLNPAEMRKLLRNELYGTASANGRKKDKIGSMPDLKKIIDQYLQ